MTTPLGVELVPYMLRMDTCNARGDGSSFFGAAVTSPHCLRLPVYGAGCACVVDFASMVPAGLGHLIVSRGYGKFDTARDYSGAGAPIRFAMAFNRPETQHVPADSRARFVLPVSGAAARVGDSCRTAVTVANSM